MKSLRHTDIVLVDIRKLCDKTHRMPHIANHARINGTSYFKPEVEDSTKLLEGGTAHQARCLEAR